MKIIRFSKGTIKNPTLNSRPVMNLDEGSLYWCHMQNSQNPNFAKFVISRFLCFAYLKSTLLILFGCILKASFTQY